MSFLSGAIKSTFLKEVVGDKYQVSYPGWGYFENVKSIECVCENKVVLRLKNGGLVITGEKLCIGSYESCDLLLTGAIKSVERI